jgi:hypothetical protein
LALKNGFADNSSFDVSVRDDYEISFGFFGSTKTETGLKDIVITVSPPPYILSEKDFYNLKLEIELNGMTIDQINNYKPANILNN